MFNDVITLLCLSVITLSQAQNSSDIAEQLADGKFSSRGDLLATKLNGDPNGDVARATETLNFDVWLSDTPTDSQIPSMPTGIIK